MNKTQQQVMEFHKAFEIPIETEPTVPNPYVQDLRVDLIDEELGELERAMLADDIVETADAIGDLLYVIYGTAISCGIDMEPIMDEIHRSNMSKVGGHKAENGKWIKPDTYSPVNLEPILQAMK